MAAVIQLEDGGGSIVDDNGLVQTAEFTFDLPDGTSVDIAESLTIVDNVLWLTDGSSEWATGSCGPRCRAS